MSITVYTRSGISTPDWILGICITLYHRSMQNINVTGISLKVFSEVIFILMSILHKWFRVGSNTKSVLFKMTDAVYNFFSS